MQAIKNCCETLDGYLALADKPLVNTQARASRFSGCLSGHSSLVNDAALHQDGYAKSAHAASM